MYKYIDSVVIPIAPWSIETQRGTTLNPEMGVIYTHNEYTCWLSRGNYVIKRQRLNHYKGWGLNPY